jgi:hypothetical protein
VMLCVVIQPDVEEVGDGLLDGDVEHGPVAAGEDCTVVDVDKDCVESIGRVFW